jgi:hypothetical protein
MESRISSRSSKTVKVSKRLLEETDELAEKLE